MESTCCSCSCGDGPVVSDPDSGVLVCSSCGLIHDAGAAEFVDYRAAESVDYTSQSSSPYRSPSAVITSTAANLGLPPAHVEEVLGMAQSATDGNLATPGITSLPALAAACAFLVARSHRIPLFLPEAASAASRTTFALADLVSSIASRLSLPPLPSFDHSAALERVVRRSRLLSASADEKMEAILSQARFLLRCASKWSLTTGRHPLPLLAGLIAFAAELNGVTSVSVEAIAQEISAVPCTSRRRYNELVAALVRVAQKLLPWGSDVDARNLLLNAPVLLRLMESDQPERFLEGFAPDIAGIVRVYSSADLEESQCLKVVDGDFNDLKTSERCMSDTYQNVLKMIDELKISERCMSDTSTYQDVLKTIAQLKISERCVPDTCQNVLKRIAQLKLHLVVGNVARRREQWKRVLELEPWMDSLDNDWTKDMLLDEVADIDIAGMGLQKSRRARIEAAKCRIDETRKAPAARSSAAEIDSPSAHGNEDVCPPEENVRQKQGRRKRRDGRDHDAMHADEMDCGKKRQKSGACKDIDSEDCVIELLLLHGANEAEIEQGQYKRLLELHVFSAVRVSGDR